MLMIARNARILMICPGADFRADANRADRLFRHSAEQVVGHMYRSNFIYDRPLPLEVAR
jgi:hypothetical protein